MSYLWFKNGSILGATAASYSIANVQASDAGDYAVRVSNAAGSVFSQSATLTVVSPSTYAITPNPATVNEGAGTLTFTITRSGGTPAETIFVSTTPTEGFANNGDYVGILNQAVSFASGQASRTVTVTINNDATVESSETFGFIAQRNSSDPVTTYLAKSTFTITDNDNAAPTLTVTAPNGGENWTAGSTHTVTWSISGSTANINYQLVALSTDGGSTYNTISAALTPESRSFNWTIPAGTSSSQARIRVRALDVSASILAADTSDANFTVTASSLPPNDNFASRITITGLTNTVTGFNAGATKESGEPNHAGNVGGKSVWWTWTAPNNRVVTIDTIGSSFDTVLAVYTGNSLPNLALVASDDDSGDGTTSKVTFSAAAGTTYQIAIDGFGGASGTIVLNIRPASPQITSQPQSQTVLAGNNAVFSVSATGAAPLAYQWRFNGTNIVGASNASYTLTNVQPADGGSYSVVVSNVAGMATSSNATLTVETVRLSSVRYATNGFQFRLTGPVGTYVIEASTDLVFWSSIATNSTSPAGVLNFTDSAAASFTRRFYRASRQ